MRNPPTVENKPIASNAAPRKRFGLTGDFGGRAGSTIVSHMSHRKLEVNFF